MSNPNTYMINPRPYFTNYSYGKPTPNHFYVKGAKRQWLWGSTALREIVNEKNFYQFINADEDNENYFNQLINTQEIMYTKKNLALNSPQGLIMPLNRITNQSNLVFIGVKLSHNQLWRLKTCRNIRNLILQIMNYTMVISLNCQGFPPNLWKQIYLEWVVKSFHSKRYTRIKVYLV